MTNFTKEQVISKFNSTYDGLSEKEAKHRLIKDGKNIINKDKKNNVVKIFVTQLINPLVIVLLASFVLSLILKEYSDAIIILAVVLLNAILSSIQEVKAEKHLNLYQN